MILANAIYFKGTWRHKFPKNKTANGGFYVSPSKIVDVPFMTTTGQFDFHESTDLDAKILRLPYKVLSKFYQLSIDNKFLGRNIFIIYFAA